MKNLVVRIKGGLGNQLFIYAFGLMLSQRLKRQLQLDYETTFQKDPYLVGVQRQFELERFGFVNKEEIAKRNFTFRNKLERKFQMLTRLHFFKSIYLSEDAAYTSIKTQSFYKNFENIFLEGYFQDADSALKVLPILKEKYQAVIKKFKNNSRENHTKKIKIVVHIREFEDGYSTLLKDYYRQGINYFLTNYQNVEFHIFSEKRLNKIIEKLFIGIEHNVHISTDEDFFKMGTFDHIIISNSTYSWWVAALAYFGSGIIIMPGHLKHKKFGNWNSDKLFLPDSVVIKI